MGTTIELDLRMGNLSGPPDGYSTYLVDREVVDGYSRKLAVRVVEASQPVDDDWEWMRSRVAAVAAIQHPVLPILHHLARYEGQHLLVTDHVLSVALADVTGPVPARTVAEIGASIASCLHFLSGRTSGTDIVHGALHQGCIRITPAGGLLLMGLVGAHPTGPHLPPLAPELMAGSTASAASDVYALAAILTELLLDAPLFDDIQMNTVLSGAHDAATFDRHITERVGHVPSGLHDTLIAALAFDPAARPSALALLERLDEITVQLDGPSLRVWALDAIRVSTAIVRGPLSGKTLSVQTGEVGLEPVPPFPPLKSTFDEQTPVDRKREEQPTVLAMGQHHHLAATPVSDVRTTVVPRDSEGKPIIEEFEESGSAEAQPSQNVPGHLPEPTVLDQPESSSSNRQFAIVAGLLATASVVLLVIAVTLMMR